ncbi:hypothetical protein E1200_27295 [Actinomadura sp. GC306]|uniref:hypothetical protein n=1 Tax=Actinomadura sp. GC306 TaxID=2530367 RepID=UPI00104FC911|nr:hypothetical protein [Actinomadura sp. GC306]TDC62013.1 hypothetical protein E1200_27295 [Actinomadura sp. GC306]
MDERTTLIESLHKTALRTYIFDPDEWESKYAFEVDNDKYRSGYAALIWSSLQIAAIRRFSPTQSLAEIIYYVADLRILLAEHASMLNPRLAEKAIRSLLGDNTFQEVPPYNESPDDMLGTALILLASFVAEAGLDESGVDELINEAADNVRQFDSSSLFAREGAGAPHLEGGRDENLSATVRRDATQEPSRGASGGWEAP